MIHILTINLGSKLIELVVMKLIGWFLDANIFVYGRLNECGGE